MAFRTKTTELNTDERAEEPNEWEKDPLYGAARETDTR